MMIAHYDKATECGKCGHYYGRDHGTYAPHNCRGTINTISVVEKPTLPDLSKLNRKDRRTMEAIARKYGIAF